MFGIGIPELVVILIVALVVLGPERLPEVARALGKGLAELRKATSGLTDELRDVTNVFEQESRALRQPRPLSRPDPAKPASAKDTAAPAEIATAAKPAEPAGAQEPDKGNDSGRSE